MVPYSREVSVLPLTAPASTAFTSTSTSLTSLRSLRHPSAAARRSVTQTLLGRDRDPGAGLRTVGQPDPVPGAGGHRGAERDSPRAWSFALIRSRTVAEHDAGRSPEVPGSRLLDRQSERACAEHVVPRGGLRQRRAHGRNRSAGCDPAQKALTDRRATQRWLVTRLAAAKLVARGRPSRVTPS